MKNVFYFFLSLMMIPQVFISAQTVSGKLVDENGDGLAQVPMQLYTSDGNYFTTSDTSGSFTFDFSATNIKDDQLPTGYSISNNYPNPFNPKTRILITLPNSEKVKVAVFNLLGEKVLEKVEQDYSPGTHFIDLELNGAANGIYFARITIGDKYSVVKKMMLIYGSQHLVSQGQVSNTFYNKTTHNFKIELETTLDSIVAENTVIGRVSFTNLPALTGNELNLSNLTIERYCQETPTVSYSGKTYNTVQIGSQCWLKENLDVGTMIPSNDSSDFQTNNSIIEKYCYDNDVNNCATYGGLYQWNEAMQYSTTPGVQGICPDGWHIPTLAEFQTLSDAVGGDGNALLSIGQGGLTDGTNTSGFSALLSGTRDIFLNGRFFGVGIYTDFWSSTEDGSKAGDMYLGSIYGDVGFSIEWVDRGFSVRCLKTEAGTKPLPPTLSSPPNGATGIQISPTLIWYAVGNADSYTLQVSIESSFSTYVYNQSGLTGTSQQINGLSDSTKYYWRVNATNSPGTSEWSNVWDFMTASGGVTCPGTPTVIYSGKIYNTVQIGSQCWLKENLDVGTMIDSLQDAQDNGVIEKYCYGNSSANCETYGGLYQWNEAMQYSTTPGVQGICPDGWHIPTVAEFQTLSDAVDSVGSSLLAVGQSHGSVSGTNASGFSALLAGIREHINTDFYGLGWYTDFWSSTEDGSMADDMYLGGNFDDVGFSSEWVERGFSIRCLKD
ncbi:MAG: FISUMP domain-containing protein [Ignavibacteria bacterium]|jgi:uncharacterized protein (TIGR02145 family)